MPANSCMRSKNIRKWCLIIVGSVIWSLTMVKSGLNYSYGIGFWGPNGHDGIWHLALAGSLSHFSLEMPVFAGQVIQNYHIGFDLFLAFLHLVTRIPISSLYFQVLPPLFAVSIGYLTYSLVNLWKHDSAAAWWAAFFVYFGGSWAWLLNSGESLFWSQQAISTLVNPPFALSLIILLLSLISMLKNKFYSTILLFAILPQIKIYAGILAFSGLLVISIYRRKYFKTLILSALLAALLYLPLNSHSSGLVVFRPFWFLQSLFTPDRLNWPRFYSALQTYYSGRILFKGFFAYFFALLVFLLGNFGTRIFFLKSLKITGLLDYLFLPAMLLGLLFPMFFLQQGTPWNTIQFFYYTLFIASIYSGIAVSRFPKIVLILIAIITLPTTVLTLNDYLPSRPPAKISRDELAALDFLSRQPHGVVYTLPFDKQKADAAIQYPPRPLYLYESTAYVAAYTGQPVYLEDTVNLNITGYNWQPRLLPPMSDGKITYYYLTSNVIFPNTRLIYSNPEIKIYRSDIFVN